MSLTSDHPASTRRGFTSQSDRDAPTQFAKRNQLSRILGGGFALLVFMIMALSVTLFVFFLSTEADISDRHSQVESRARSIPSASYELADVSTLPAPVQRYFDYVFVEPQVSLSFVQLSMEGEFRRPLREDFEFTTAEQTIGIGTPALMFSATTTVFPGVWARVYDVYSEGEMQMKAKVMSALTVVDEKESPELNRISLRRWLLESPLYPAALLPGGPVRWQAVDDNHARAIVSADGLEASLLASFRADGSLESFDAETDGDLTTPYHGSGEHAYRDDYRLVSGMMIPHSFSIARAANDQIYPFWTGQITSISYTAFSAETR
jgi:hypothetical protein